MSVSSPYATSSLIIYASRLKQFDESTTSSRKGSQAPTPPKSVVGIGNKGNIHPYVPDILEVYLFSISCKARLFRSQDRVGYGQSSDLSSNLTMNSFIRSAYPPEANHISATNL